MIREFWRKNAGKLRHGIPVERSLFVVKPEAFDHRNNIQKYIQDAGLIIIVSL